MFNNLLNYIDDCLMDLDRKVASGGSVDDNDLHYADVMAHLAKSLDTHAAMREQGGYSARDYRDGGDMSRGRVYRNGSSYHDGNRRTYPMTRDGGGYSRADRMDEVVQAMGGAMDDMPEDLRREAQRFLTKMQHQM